jgi:hypothetical protein
MKNVYPFPQADDIYKLLIHLFSLSNTSVPEELSSMSIKEMVPRQVSYYIAALEFLGLIKNGWITDEGTIIVNSSIKVMLRLLAFRILLFEPFSSFYHSRDKAIIKDYLLGNLGLSESTVNRRTQTVVAWVNWIDQVISR